MGTFASRPSNPRSTDARTRRSRGDSSLLFSPDGRDLLLNLKLDDQVNPAGDDTTGSTGVNVNASLNGINTQIPVGQTVVSASLSFNKISNWNNDPNDLFVHLFDTAKNAGLTTQQEEPNSQTSDTPDDELVGPNYSISYPSPNMIKEMAEGRMDLPFDPETRAMVKLEIARYEANQKKKGSDNNWTGNVDLASNGSYPAL